MNKFASYFKPLAWFLPVLLATFVAGCGGGDGSGGAGTVASASVLPGAAGTSGAAATNPTVGSASPASGATNVATSTSGPGGTVTGTLLTATFTQAMDPTTITPVGTFTLKQTVAGTNVPGTVTMNAANTIATFTPTAAALLAGTQYTATITTAAKNAGGTPMPSLVSWSFTTNAVASTSLAPVNLGAAGNFTILTQTGISTDVPAGTLVTGDIGVSPGFATLITNFALVADPSNVFSTSFRVVGKVFAADYAPPTPANLTTAVANMQTAYTDAAGRPAGVGPFLNRGTGTLTGLTLAPGVYTWNTPGTPGGNVTIPTDLTLSGGADDVWIFQIEGTLDLAANMKILLTGGAQAKNVFWQVAGAVNLLAGSHFEGNLLAQTNIAMANGASAKSRLLAQTAVTLINNAVTPPAP